uniref:Intron-binding protein aquarius N-terminal domain-containing protein n=1 Tax=Brassica campestris TaxID=3711 RepID=M4DKR9_BRACM
MVLEVSQYLENYLWPNFDPEAASFEHVMSMILMINEKFRENVAAWICFHDREDLFKKFLQKVLRLKEGRELTIAEKTNYLVFMINAFQSLEDGVVNETVLSLAGLQSWHSLSYGRFQMELCLQPDLIKKWKRSSKKWAAEAMSKGEQFDPSSSPEANFVRGLIEEFVEVLDHGVFAEEVDDTAVSQLVDDSSVLYCERFMEFLIDMLNQLPTRRYLRPLVADIAVVAKCRLSVLYKHENGKLFAQLVDLLQFYEKFEIKDHDGTQLTDDEALQFHYVLWRFSYLPLRKYLRYFLLQDVSLANIGSVHKSSDLRRRLSALSLEDLRDVVCSKVSFVNADGAEVLDPRPPFRITLPKTLKGNANALSGNKISEVDPAENVDMVDVSPKEKLIVEAYTPPDPGPYPQDQPKQNSVKFTPTQVGAIISGIQPGLTMVVRPPGTGKTDTAVQILNVLYHNCPSQRTLIITHSNQALNDLFEKIMERDVPARYLLRLGQGEQELATDLDFSRQGRVNAMLVRRLELLSEVERLARSLQLPEDVGYTCETAGYFWLLHVYSRWELFLAACAGNKNNPSFVQDRFPFKEFFSDAPKPVFSGESFEKDMRAAKGCFTHLKTVFQELEECRAFELLKSTADRANYLMTKQAKIVAMTCTHAALKRRDFLKLGFKYDNLLMEESAQILEIETFIPMLLQRQEDGVSRLKRCILIGDHHQLPPVVKNMAFQKYSHMDQSLFTRFVRLGIPYIELNAQGRARPSLAKLYNWRYRDLGDLSIVKEAPIFHRANAGFSYDYQLINVPDYEGRGESTPSPWFYQNQGEAEYIVSVYIYMRLLGYPANKISILTTYNGQKLLVRDVINRRCVPYSFIGPPSKVTTVDKFQGQQNDFILLSLVRTRFVGHLRDVRRLVVAMSRARLDRAVEEVGNPYLVHDVEEMAHIVHDRMNEFYKAQGVYEQYQNHSPQIEDGNHMESDAVLGEDGEPEMKMQPQIEDGDHDMESDTVVSEDGESEKKMQPVVDGVVEESSKETVGMEVDYGFSSENAKA